MKLRKVTFENRNVLTVARGVRMLREARPLREVLKHCSLAAWSILLHGSVRINVQHYI
jgi:hypothetical protein